MEIQLFRMPLRPLNPMLHASYTDALFGSGAAIPEKVRTQVRDYLALRNTAPEDEIERIDAQIVDALWWYVLRPDDIARRTLQYRGWSVRRILSISQATVVIAALAEDGYPICGGGAPDVDVRPQPVSGYERERVLWQAAEYWARMAAEPATYVSFGDARGYMPRAVQYDEPGTVHQLQMAALTFGPASDLPNKRALMRRHTRLLLRVAREC